MKKKVLVLLINMLLITTTITVLGISDNYTNPQTTIDPVSWLQYGNDGANTGFSSSLAPETNDTFLETQIFPSDVDVYASPMITGDYLLIGGEKYFYCVNAYNGLIYWDSQIGTLGQIITSGAINDDSYYQGTNLYGLQSYDIESGNVSWEFPSNAARTHITFSNDHIFYGSSLTVFTGILYCINTNGTEDWSFSWSQNPSSNIAPAVADDVVIIQSYIFQGGSYHGKVYCLEEATGNELWSYPVPNSLTTSSIVSEGKVYITGGNTLYCLDAVGNGDGTTYDHWTFTSSSELKSPALGYGKIYFGSEDGTFYCLDANNGSQIWEVQLDGIVAIPGIADDKIFVGTSTGMIYCLWAQNGSEVWNYTTSHMIRNQPAITNERVWFITDDLYIFGFGEGDFTNYPPEIPDPPIGPSEGYTGIEYEFTASTTDPNNDTISYRFFWGDGTQSEWTNYVPSGSSVTMSHSWDREDTFLILVKAKDEFGLESDWSEPSLITITILPKPDLKITSIEGGAGVIVTILNNGTADATDIIWNINIKGGFIIQPRNATNQIHLLAPWAEAMVHRPVIGFGLGIIFQIPKILVDIKCNENSSASDTREAKIILNRVTIQ